MDDDKYTILLIFIVGIFVSVIFLAITTLSETADIKSEQQMIIKMLEDPEYYDAYKKWNEVNSND